MRGAETSSRTKQKPGRNEKEKYRVKLNLWTSITQDWATGHVGLQLLASMRSVFQGNSFRSRWCRSEKAEINFTLVSPFPFAPRCCETIMIKIGFPWSDSSRNQESIDRMKNPQPFSARATFRYPFSHSHTGILICKLGRSERNNWRNQ